LLTADGRVAGVNYAGGQVATTAQFYAIAASLAQDVVTRLHDGDFESLGINGFSVYEEGTGLAGIWVAGVAPGSPASMADVAPGDVVTSLNGLPVGVDGTFRDYCDVIRTAGDRPIAVEVVRYATGEVLTGEINGERPLAPVEPPSPTPEPQPEPQPEPDPEYSDYASLVDDTGLMTVEVPAEWSSTITQPLEIDGVGSVPYIAASPDLDGYTQTWTTPGVELMALPGQLPVPDLLDAFAPGDQCTDEGVTDYADGVFVGQSQMWSGCGDSEAIYVVLAATPVGDEPYTFVLLVQVVTSADGDAFGHILGTFNFA
jgi:serine protease Do